MYRLASSGRETFESRFTGFESSGIGLSKPELGVEDGWGVRDAGWVGGAEDMDAEWGKGDATTVIGVC